MAKKQKHLGGRPKKIGPAERQRILDIVTEGGSLTDAAARIGVDYKTLWNERKREPAFSKAIKAAEAEGKLKLIKKIGDAEPWQAAAWMLERKYGAEYGKKMDVTSDGKPVSFTLNIGKVDGSDEAESD